MYDFKFLISETLRVLLNQRPALKPGFSGWHNHSDLFEQLPQIFKHDVFFVRARAIGDKELLAQVQVLVPLLQRYQAYPLSKPGIDLCTPDFLSRSVPYQSISHRTDRMVFSRPN